MQITARRQIQIFLLILFVQGGFETSVARIGSNESEIDTFSKWTQVDSLARRMTRVSETEMLWIKNEILSILLMEVPDYPIVFVDINAAGKNNGTDRNKRNSYRLWLTKDPIFSDTLDYIEYIKRCNGNNQSALICRPQHNGQYIERKEYFGKCDSLDYGRVVAKGRCDAKNYKQDNPDIGGITILPKK